jgi:hypothetical protein
MHALLALVSAGLLIAADAKDDDIKGQEQKQQQQKDKDDDKVKTTRP